VNQLLNLSLCKVPFLCFFVMCQLDIVIDNVASTVLILEAVQSSMNKMNADELSAFQLDANLGGTSAVLQRKSVERFLFVFVHVRNI